MLLFLLYQANPKGLSEAKSKRKNKIKNHSKQPYLHTKFDRSKTNQ